MKTMFTAHTLSWVAIAVLAVCSVPSVGHAQKAASPTATETAAKPTAAAQKAVAVQTVEGITEYRLPNGLRILLAPDGADQRVSVNVTYLVGSRHEGYGETGMAHLLEHLVFKGTPTTKDPKAEFRKRGFNFNGTTNTDRTDYYATFTSNQENLNWYIDWQADAMVNSFIAKSDLDSEMTVVRNEFEQSDSNPVQVLVRTMLGTAYMWHNYGKSTIGSKADVEQVDIANLKSFYQRHYRPDNAAIIVAGKFDPTATLAAIERAFGALVKPNAALQRTYTIDPVQDGERSAVVRRPAPIQLMASSYHAPPALHPDAHAFAVLATVLTDAPAGRLHKALVETKQAQGVFGVPFSRTEGSTYFFGAVMGPADEPESRKKIILDIVEGIASRPITPEEFDRAKIKLTKANELGFASAAAVAAGAMNSFVHGDWRAVFVGRERLKAVTLDDVNRVAKTYLLPTNRTFGHLVPTEKPLRAPEPALANVANYMKGFALKAEGEASVAFDYALSNIAKQTVMHTTPGGIKTAVLNKPVRGDVITLSMQLRFGDVNSLKGQVPAASMAGQLLKSGTSTMSRQAITDGFAKLGAQVNYGLGAEGGNVSVVVKKADFAPAFALMAHVLKNASMPDAQFAETHAAILSSLDGSVKDQSVRAANEWATYGNPYPADDVRHAPKLAATIESYKKLTPADARNFYKRFYGAQNALVSVVGPIEPGVVQAMVSAEFDNWKSAQPYTRISRPLVTKTPTTLVFDTPDKANASIDSSLAVPLKSFDDESFALQLATRIFGGGPGSRLWTRMREKDGLTYGATASFGAAYLDANGNVSFDVDVNPANLSKADAVMKEELATSLEKGFTQDELDRMKAQVQADRVRSRSGDGWALGQLSWQLMHGTPWELALTNDAKYKSVTLEQTNAAWRKFVQPKNIVWAQFADKSKAK